MAKKKELGLCALTDNAGYFSVRKVSSGTQKNGFQLRKYNPRLRKHVLVKSGKSSMIKAS